MTMRKEKYNMNQKYIGIIAGIFIDIWDFIKWSDKKTFTEVYKNICERGDYCEHTVEDEVVMDGEFTAEELIIIAGELKKRK